ncbi:MAG TPA: hypothetical protein VGH42_07605 [Verrucomicrobiae bacterium]|jgi:uncharacterized repeat protein (TIGR01451 family)
MKNNFARCFALMLGLLLAFTVAARAEHHRATRLGNPATRFAPALHTPDDLRARFRDDELRPDFAEILRQWGWQGNIEDFFAAGLTNEIVEWQIPVGGTMPFMSSREDGKPVCLRNVKWAGQEPVPAYAFNFVSKGERYRCVVPKPCSNFFIEDLGPEPRSGLAIDCNVPEKIIAGRKMEVCLTVHNTGNILEPEAVATLQLPADTVVTATTDGGIVTNNSVRWEISGLPPGSAKEVCTMLKSIQPGALVFNSAAASANVPPVESSCETVVIGIPAILLEKADDPDPVSIGDTTTYTVKVTNQGTADDSNVQVVVAVAPELTPVSSSEGTIDGQTVTLPAVPHLAARQSVTYKITARGVSAGDGHTKFTLSSDVLKSPIFAEESTTVY